MIKHFRNLSFTIVFLGLHFLAHCHADLIVFGDSLSDEGNFSLVSGGALPPTPLYSGGRFSNGPVWTERLAAAMGQPIAFPSLVGGTNYAFNGSRAAGASPYGTPDLVAQVESYLFANGGVADPDDVFVIWAGANDIFYGAASGEVNFVPEAIQAIDGAIRDLYDAGARNFVILDLPLLGQTPFFNSVPPAASALNSATSAFNSLLAAQLQSLDTELRRIRIADVKVSRLFQAVTRTPRLFGFRNVVDSATLFDPVTGLGYALAPNVDPNRYLFWDSIHPTAQGHKIIAAFAFIDIKIHCGYR
jgi:thermolabile hemolysin